uniref:Transcription factor 25 n=1 Tax=Arion vulgaris TaxID=1028688 RepID=A0A0B6ZE96_9EUPU
MSSRALKRLQKDSRLTELVGNINDDDEIENENDDDTTATSTTQLSSHKNKRGSSKKEQKKVTENPFELLNKDEEDYSEAEKEEDAHEDIQNKQQTDTSQVKSKKKKKKNKIKRKESENDHVQQPEVVDEVEASLQEVNRILGDPGTAILHEPNNGVSFSASMKPLLHLDFRNLNPEVELKRVFGSEAIRGEQPNRNRRQRNRPVQRASRLVQVKDTWHSVRGLGLSMKYIEQTQEFVFEHSLAYQKLQHKFADAVDSVYADNIVPILRENPYHIDTLILMADSQRMNEDFQLAAECIEKALYGLECAFHPLFNLAAGNCYLNYKRVENRAFFLCLFKHILNLGRRSCNRTAFEFCKLLLSLDPEGDPLDCMNMIDYFALRSEQFDHLIQLEQEVMSFDSLRKVPNFAMSIPLAHFKIACRDDAATTTADHKLQDALLYFPMMLMPLLEECSVQPDRRVSSHAFFNTAELNDSSNELGNLIKLYVKRCVSCWKEAEIMSWLERNVMTVLSIVDVGTDPRLQNYAKMRQQSFRHPPLRLLRHYFLSEIPGVRIQQQHSTATILSHDPFPPPDSIRTYTRPPRPTVASRDQSGFFRSLLQSLLPSYNPNELADEANRQNDEDGAGAQASIPQQINQSVNAVMQAMRYLINESFAGQAPPAAAAAPDAEEEDHQNLEENDRDWPDEDRE